MKSSHNIDKLFADKLSTLESTPSADAWMALEKGLQQNKRKKAIWLPYAAAAAITILIISGVLLYTQAPGTGPVISTTRPVKEKNHTIIKETAPIQQGIPTEKHVTQPDQIAQQPANNQPNILHQEANTTERTIAQKKEAKEIKKPGSRPAEKGPEALPQLPVVQETIALQQTVPSPQVTPTAISAEPSTIVVTVQLAETENPESTEEFTAPEKQGKAARILDKLRKLKKGEFNELGIRKETLVAFVKVNTSRAAHPNSNRE